MGSRKPSSAAFGSVVGLPSLSVAQVGGIDFAALGGIADLGARHHAESAMSRMIGCPPGLGTQKPTGLLPSRASRPPHGAMVVEALLPMMLANPASAAMRRVGRHRAEMVARAGEGDAHARFAREPIAACSARMPTSGPTPLSPSTFAMAGATFSTRMSGSALMPPRSSRSP